MPLILSWWKKVNLLQLPFNLDRWTLKQEPVPNKSHAWAREAERGRERDPAEVCLCLTLSFKVRANRSQLPQCPN